MLVILAGLLPQAASAAITTVNCSALPDDITAVQNAIDTAAAGDTIRLGGVCDFALALPHEGDITSNPVAAVVVGVNAINGLTIEGVDANTIVLGNGLNTAFLIGPSATNVTIRKLKMINHARSVVSINTDGTTVGAVGATPDPNGLRIIGTATMDSAILGLAVDRHPSVSTPSGNVTVSYGLEAANTKTWTGQATGTLRNYTVAGNYVTYAPPGVEGVLPSVVAIDIRQRFERVVQNVDILNNAVGMFSPTFLTPNMNGIKLHSLTPLSTPVTGTPMDYYIRDVTITGNNLGRLEELGNPLADIHATGRIGISMTGVGDFTIAGNGVRVVETPTLIPMPGGGIVVSDSGFGRIAGNGINVLGTPEGETSDFGAIGVVDNIGTLFRDPPKPQPTRNIDVENNIIGTVDPNTRGINNRGIVVAGASLIRVRNNTTELTLSDAIHIAPILEGPGSLDDPGPVRLKPADVISSSFCNNILDGTLDNPNEVSAGAGGAVINSVYPGAVGPSNGVCAPFTLVFVPTDNTPPLVKEEGETPDGVSFRLSRPPTAPVTVTVTTDADTTPVTATLTFSPANWKIYQWAVAKAVDDLLVEGTELSTVTFSFSSADPDWNTAAPVSVQYIVIDNDLSLFNVVPQLLNIGESGPNGAYQVSLTMAPPADVVVSLEPGDPQWYTTDGPLRFTPANWAVPQTIRVFATDDIFREGTPHFGLVRHVSRSSAFQWNLAPVPNVLLSITDNDGPNAALITAPAGGSCLADPNVIFSGSGENGATVELYENNVLLGSTTVVAGAWTMGPFTFSEGTHTVSTRQIGVDGLVSPHSGSITFTIDTVAPAAPVITSPLDGDTVTGSPVTVTGTSEPYARIVLRRSGVPFAFGQANSAGDWSISAPLSAGPAVLDAIAVDCASSASGASNVVNITVANPTAPVILTPAEGAYVRPSVLVTGTASPGTLVRLQEGGVTIRDNIAVSGAGVWMVTLNFSAGPHSIVAFARAGSTISDPSNIRSFIVDGVAPSVTINQPPLELIAQVSLPVESLLVSGTATDDNGVAQVTVEYSDLLSDNVVQTTLAATCTLCPGASVDWEDAPALGPGLYRVRARAYDRAGNISGLRSIILVNLSTT